MKNSGHYSWSMVETVACQNNIYTKALQAAKESDDEEITTWLHEVMNDDLGIVDAHYHQKKTVFSITPTLFILKKPNRNQKIRLPFRSQ